MVVLNARDIDATFPRISLWNLNLYLFFQTGKKHTIHSRLSYDSETLFTWPLAGNVVSNI